MSFTEGLIKARSHIVLLLGMVAAIGLVAKLESWHPRLSPDLTVYPSAGFPQPPQMPLTSTEQQWAKVAWRYFEHNYEPDTGLVNAVDGYPASTMWDTASYLLAMLSAYRLALISRDEFDRKLSQLLASLAKMPLFADLLPNKSYNTRSLAMVNYDNAASGRGIGWSAIDIGRLLVPLHIIVWHFPTHTEAIKAVMRRWQLRALAQEGVLYGTHVDSQGEIVRVQEGRIGYEEYAARAIGMLGLDVSQALQYNDYLRFVKVYGIEIPTDRREPALYEAHNYVVSEPYILDVIELGGDRLAREFAFRVYRAQEERFNRTGVLTAVSEDHIDQPPYFVYNTIFTGGKLWGAITSTGADASRFKTLSTKAAFGWYALYRTPYTQRLRQHVQDLYDTDRGWYSGMYEATQTPNRALTANTNAIILESLCYQQFGPLLGLSREDGRRDGATAAKAIERFGTSH